MSMARNFDLDDNTMSCEFHVTNKKQIIIT